MSKSDPQSRWAVKQLKKQQKLDREMKRCGMMNDRGILSPSYMRSFFHSNAGKMSNKNIVILAGLIVTFAAIGGGLAYMEMGHGHHTDSSSHHDSGHHDVTPPPVHNNTPPEIRSWYVESGNSYTPHFWVNATDDKSVESIVISIYNTTGKLEKLFEKTYNPRTKDANVSGELDLSKFMPGDYNVKVQAKDKEGNVSSQLEQMLNLPMLDMNPATPWIVPWVRWDANASVWRIGANITDSNGDLDKAYIYLSLPEYNNVTGFENEYNISGLKSYVEFAGRFNPGTTYWASIWAVDKAGHRSDTSCVKFVA